MKGFPEIRQAVLVQIASQLTKAALRCPQFGDLDIGELPLPQC